MAYVASLLTDEWRDGLLHECMSYRLLSDGAGAFQLARNGHEGVEDVGVELQVDMIKYSEQLRLLLQHTDTPFFVMAVCKRDPLAPPIALDLYVDAAAFEESMKHVGTVAGECAVVDMLTAAARHNLVVKRAVAPSVSPRDRLVSKRRCVIPHPFQSGTDLVNRITAREHSHGQMGMPLFLTIPGSTYVFCMKEYAFVPQSYGFFEAVTLNGGVIVGDRGADKTELVKQVVTKTRAESLGNNRSTPPFLRPVKATLLVVPTALVEQWHAALSPTCHVIVVLNNRMLYQCATFADVAACDVVIVTHMFYMTLLRKLTSKHKARVCAREPLSEVAHQYCRLDWVFWKRVVFDEALHLYMMWSRRKAVHAVARGKMVWLLQGGVEVTSVATAALLDLLMQHTNPSRRRVGWLNVSAVELDCFLHATSLHRMNQVHMEMVVTELTPTETCAYNVLQRVRTTTQEDLLQVAAGELRPMIKFMHPVVSWGNAVSIGSTILNKYIASTSEVEFVWSELDEDEEEEDEQEQEQDENETEQEQEPRGGNAVGVQTGGGGSEGLEGEESEDVPLQQELDNMLEELVDDAANEMRERLEFFKRAAGELNRGEQEVACCSICLTSMCDCLFVCGHMLCHECVVNLFLTSKKRETQELEQQGLVPSHDGGYLAQCPQCRWSLEPHEVFWVTGLLNKNKKHEVLSRLLQRLVLENESVLVLGTIPDVLLKLFQNVADDGVPSKVMTYSPVTCRHALSWFNGSKGRVLFCYADQVTGLKLPYVKHVVIVHPHIHGLVQQEVLNDAVMQCVNNGDKERTVHIHRLIAANTVEEATT